jgi:hypothetical protein
MKLSRGVDGGLQSIQKKPSKQRFTVAVSMHVSNKRWYALKDEQLELGHKWCRSVSDDSRS